MTQTAISGYSARTVTMWETSIAVSIGSGPFNQHNFFVKNATDLLKRNQLDYPKLYHILPFGGSGRHLSDLIATTVWYAILAMMIVILTSKTFGIVVGIFLEIYFVACIVLIIRNYYMTVEKLRYHIEVESLNSTRNRFFEIRETIDTVASFLTVSDRQWLVGMVYNRRTERSIDIMLYTNSYKLLRIVWPLLQFTVCAILNIVFMAN